MGAMKTTILACHVFHPIVEYMMMEKKYLSRDLKIKHVAVHASPVFVGNALANMPAWAVNDSCAMVSHVCDPRSGKFERNGGVLEWLLALSMGGVGEWLHREHGQCCKLRKDR